MKFTLDTNNYEGIELKLTDEEYDRETEEIIEEFCFAIASFLADFTIKFNCDAEQAKGLVKVCLQCIENDINHLIEQGLIEEYGYKNDEELSEERHITETENIVPGKAELIEKLKGYGFSEEEIAGVVNIIDELGSFELAIEYLKKIGKEHGINFDEDNDN